MEAYAGDFFGSVPTTGAAHGTRKHGIRRKTPILYVAFSVLVHKHTYCSYDFFQRLFFLASSTVVHFLHCIPQVQALKVLTYDKRLFVSSIRIYRQSRPRTMTTPNIYHHMGKLVQAKFVNTRIDRNRNYYSINQLLDELKGILRC